MLAREADRVVSRCHCGVLARRKSEIPEPMSSIQTTFVPGILVLCLPCQFSAGRASVGEKCSAILTHLPGTTVALATGESRPLDIGGFIRIFAVLAL